MRKYTSWYDCNWMMVAGAACVLLILTGCTSALYPINEQYKAGTDESCNSKTPELELTRCQLSEKVVEIDKQHNSLLNSSELFDLPLIAAAGTTAGLLLFDGGTTALAAAGLGAGTIGVTRTYASPGEARRMLRRGSAGYTCLLQHTNETAKFAAEFLGTAADPRTDRLKLRNNLVAYLTALRVAQLRSLAQPEVQELLDSANAAISLFDAQRAAAEVANSRLRMAAHRLGIALVQQSERQAVDFNQILQNLLATERLRENFNQAAQGANAGAGAGAEGVIDPEIAAKSNDAALNAAKNVLVGKQKADDLRELIPRIRRDIAKLTTGMISMDTLLASADSCATAAIADEALPTITLVFAPIPTVTQSQR